MIYKNGVPIGYFEGLSLFERMESGFNLYYTFRDGETAWLYARTLNVMHISPASQRSRSILIKLDMRTRKESNRARSGFIASSAFDQRAKRRCNLR